MAKTPSDFDEEIAKKKLYFINEIVEYQLTQYLWTGCTRAYLRDQIMSHASELIKQIIRKQGLHTIYPGQDDSSMGDLINTAWCQVEKTLYKYRARPHCRSCYSPLKPSESTLYEPGDYEYGILTMPEVIDLHNGKCPRCNSVLEAVTVVLPQQGQYGGSETILYRGISKVFNMWSQVSRTVILAYIKKEGRDRRNSNTYISHLGNKSKPKNDMLDRFLQEVKDISRYNDTHLEIIAGLERLIENDEKPYDGMISKLVSETGQSRAVVTNFIKMVKLRSFEFTDSPLNLAAKSENLAKDKQAVEEEI